MKVIGIVGLLLTFIAVVASVATPELRCQLGLEKCSKEPDLQQEQRAELERQRAQLEREKSRLIEEAKRLELAKLRAEQEWLKQQRAELERLRTQLEWEKSRKKTRQAELARQEQLEQQQTEFKWRRTQSKKSRQNANQAHFTEKKIRDFIQRVLSASNQGDVDTILNYYAQKVNYYKYGWVDKEFVQKDMLNFFNKWPSRKYTFQSDVKILSTSQLNEKVIKFRVDFFVHNPYKEKWPKIISGKTEATWKLRSIGIELQIFDLKEKILKKRKR
jgi:hypothetical protein